MFKVIVAGSRSFNDYTLLKKELIQFLKGRKVCEVEIVSGTARGADQLGERFAKEYGCTLAGFPADWETHGKSAGYLRNKDMAEYADALVLFWDGQSKGSGHMLKLAQERNLEIKLVVRHVKE